MVSDHGGYMGNNFPYQVKLPNGQYLQSYNILLMEKDFNSKGKLTTNDSFMTIADVPLMALNGIVKNPVNPYTHNELKTEKSNRIMITTSSTLHPTSHLKYKFNIAKNEWLSVKDNIFDPKNWKNENFD